MTISHLRRDSEWHMPHNRRGVSMLSTRSKNLSKNTRKIDTSEALLSPCSSLAPFNFCFCDLR